MHASNDMELQNDSIGCVDRSIAVELAQFYRCKGYFRRQNPARVTAEGRTDYKQGDVVRFVVASLADLDRLHELLC